jgi:ABC-type uncharacterized transport system substrate-binding protein
MRQGGIHEEAVRGGLAALLLGSAAWAETRTILVIESYSKDYKWDADYTGALKEQLGKDYALEFFEMNTKKLPKDQHQGMADAAWARYQALKPALVIMGDDAAVKFLGAKFAAEKVPVVFLGINANLRTYLPKLPENMTGILERPVLKRSVANIGKLLPTAKKGLILFDTDLTAQAVKLEVFENKDRADIEDIDVDLRLIGSYADWQAAVSGAKGKYDFIIAGLYQTIKDPAGANVDQVSIIKWTSANTPVPLFCFWDFSVGAEMAIGGSVLFGKDMGGLAADMARKILAGTPPAKIPYVNNTQGLYLFSKAQLAKWKIDLPADIKATAILVD